LPVLFGEAVHNGENRSPLVLESGEQLVAFLDVIFSHT
jgi:hypothetical protein